MLYPCPSRTRSTLVLRPSPSSIAAPRFVPALRLSPSSIGTPRSAPRPRPRPRASPPRATPLTATPIRASREQPLSVLISPQGAILVSECLHNVSPPLAAAPRRAGLAA